MRVGAIFFGFIGAGAVRCEFLKFFVVLVRCGPGFRNFWATGAVRCEIFWAIIIGHLIFNLVDYDKSIR